MKDVRSQPFFKDGEVIVTIGKYGIAEAFKKYCIVKCYHHISVLGNTARPGCGEGERHVHNPNKLTNDVIVGDAHAVDRTMQTSAEIFARVDET